MVDGHNAEWDAVVIHKTLDNRFKIERRIASGGWGIVYRAWDSELKADVAVKIVPISQNDPAMVEHALQEAIRASTASFKSQHFLNIFSCNLLGNNTADNLPTDAIWFAMQYIEDAQTLDEYTATSTPEVTDVVTLIRQICLGLANLHAGHNSMSHCDIKPTNILIDTNTPDRKPLVKIIDLGISNDPSTLWSGHEVERSDRFACPDAKQRTWQSDVYSVGLMLKEYVHSAANHYGEAVDCILEALIEVATSEDPERRMRAQCLADFLGVWEDVNTRYKSAPSNARESMFEYLVEWTSQRGSEPGEKIHGWQMVAIVSLHLASEPADHACAGEMPEINPLLHWRNGSLAAIMAARLQVHQPNVPMHEVEQWIEDKCRQIWASRQKLNPEQLSWEKLPEDEQLVMFYSFEIHQKAVIARHVIKNRCDLEYLAQPTTEDEIRSGIKYFGHIPDEIAVPDPELRCLLVQSLICQSKFDEALKTANELLNATSGQLSQPHRRELLLLRAKCHQIFGNNTQALRDVESVLDDPPFNDWHTDNASKLLVQIKADCSEPLTHAVATTYETKLSRIAAHQESDNGKGHVFPLMTHLQRVTLLTRQQQILDAKDLHADKIQGQWSSNCPILRELSLDIQSTYCDLAEMCLQAEEPECARYWEHQVAKFVQILSDSASDTTRPRDS